MITDTELSELETSVEFLDGDEQMEVPAYQMRALLEYVRGLEDDIMDLRHQMAEVTEDDLFADDEPEPDPVY